METDAILHRRKIKDYQLLMRSYNSKIDCLLYDLERKGKENEDLALER